MKSSGRLLLLQTATPIVAVFAGGVIASTIILAIHENPLSVFALMATFNMQASSVASILTSATPLIFAGLATAIGFQVNVFNIGIEGQYYPAHRADPPGRAWRRLLGAGRRGEHRPRRDDDHGHVLLCPRRVSARSTRGRAVRHLGGAGLGLIHAVVTVTFGVDQIIAGVALNLLAAGVARFLTIQVFGVATQSPGVSGFVPFSIPGLDHIHALAPLMTGISPLVPITLALVLPGQWVLRRTAFGLRLRAVGENAPAAETLGIHVYRMRYTGVLLSGALAGDPVSVHPVVAVRRHHPGPGGIRPPRQAPGGGRRPVPKGRGRVMPRQLSVSPGEV